MIVNDFSLLKEQFNSRRDGKSDKLSRSTILLWEISRILRATNDDISGTKVNKLFETLIWIVNSGFCTKGNSFKAWPDWLTLSELTSLLFGLSRGKNKDINLNE